MAIEDENRRRTDYAGEDWPRDTVLDGVENRLRSAKPRDFLQFRPNGVEVDDMRGLTLGQALSLLVDDGLLEPEVKDGKHGFIKARATEVYAIEGGELETESHLHRAVEITADEEQTRINSLNINDKTSLMDVLGLLLRNEEYKSRKVYGFSAFDGEIPQGLLLNLTNKVDRYGPNTTLELIFGVIKNFLIEYFSGIPMGDVVPGRMADEWAGAIAKVIYAKFRQKVI